MSTHISIFDYNTFLAARGIRKLYYIYRKMLLRVNFNILSSLRLCQADHSNMRLYFNHIEKLSKTQQKIVFLKKCKQHGIFPNTIENLHLPSCFKEKNMQMFVRTMKFSIMKQMVRSLYTEQNSLNISITQMEFNSEYRTLKGLMMKYKYCVRKNSRDSYELKMSNKFRHLIRKGTQNMMKLNSQYTRNSSRPNDAHCSNRDMTHNNARLVTDMTKSLTREEMNVLAKGPDFGIKAEINKRTINGIKTSFCRLAYQIRWKDFIDQQDTQQPSFVKYPVPNNLSYPPQRNNLLEDKLKRIYGKIDGVISNIRSSDIKPNVSKSEVKILNNLSKKDIVCLPSDKGKEFCVIEKDRYDSAALEHLNDINIYKQIKRLTVGTIEHKINNVWKKVCEEVELPKHIQSSYITNNSSFSKFYALIKTHKNGSAIKIRPIVSNVNSPTTRLSWLLQHLLIFLLGRVPAHLESSTQLINHINQLSNNTKQQNPYPASLDVVALYTSIPPMNAIIVVDDMLMKEHFSYFGITKRHINTLLKCILNSTYFTFKGNIYKQIQGLPMGNSISGTLAILYMNNLESKIFIDNTVSVALYKRYIDDILILCPNKTDAELFYRRINNIDPSIKFEIEHPDDTGKLNLLDFSIRINNEGKAEYNFYKKAALSDIFMHYESALPITTKEHVITNEYRRIAFRCSNADSKKQGRNQFTEKLKINKYPESIIKKCYNKSRKYTQHQTAPPNIYYFNFPYLSDKTNFKIKKIFKDENINIRLYDNKYTIRNKLNQNKYNYHKDCTKAHCPIKNPRKCYQKLCVYHIQCESCRKSYIGSTVRSLHTRIVEHHTQKTSSVRRHLNECNSGLTITILDKANDVVNLRIKEGIYIRQLQPEINTQEEINDVSCLVY